MNLPPSETDHHKVVDHISSMQYEEDSCSSSNTICLPSAVRTGIPVEISFSKYRGINLNNVKVNNENTEDSKQLTRHRFSSAQPLHPSVSAQ